MTLPYQTINDAKFDFLSEEGNFRVAMRSAINKKGRKKIIFVEGYDDQVIFEILSEEYLSKVAFIDVSLEEPKKTSDFEIIVSGGCDQVKSLLKSFVKFLPQEKRYYGVIDRDLKFDQDIEVERNESDYDGRLFIFQERYTMENYFVDFGILKGLIEGQSLNHKGLIPLKDNDAKLQGIIDTIISCMAEIAAANLTIRFFNNSASFIESTIKRDEIKVRIHHRLNQCENYVKSFVDSKFEHFRNFIMQSPHNVQKFANAKTYFATQFNKKLEVDHRVNLQINHHKSELARILKGNLPNEFKKLLQFFGI